MSDDSSVNHKISLPVLWHAARSLHTAVDRTSLERYVLRQHYCGLTATRVSIDFGCAIGVLQEVDGRITIHDDFPTTTLGSEDGFISSSEVAWRVLRWSLRIGFWDGVANAGGLRQIDGIGAFFQSAAIPYQVIFALRVLLHCGIIQPAESMPSWYRITNDYLDGAIKLLRNYHPRPTLSPHELAQKLKAQQERGEAAEKFVVKFEADRLGIDVMDARLQRVSAFNVAAGYDVASIDSVEAILPNRFIEVKSHAGTAQVYISANELATADRLGDKYWLYIIDSLRLTEKGYSPRMIQNAAKWIRSVNPESIQSAAWRVSVAGEAGSALFGYQCEDAFDLLVEPSLGLDTALPDNS